MAYLNAPDANAVVQYVAGLLADIPAGPWTIGVIFRRSGTTTDGYENLFALETSGGQVITNVGTDATTSPYAIQCGQGGASRTFTGLDDLADGDDYELIIRKTNGTVNPRANLYRFDAGVPAWHGWVTGAGGGDFENRSDTIDRAKSHNQQGGFPFRGGIYLIAVWDDALDEADVTDGSIGLHIGVQQWLDIAPAAGPVTLLRPGEVNPIVDESASGTSDESSRSGTLDLTAGWPVNFNGDFDAGGVTGEIAGTLPDLTGDLAGVGSAAGTVADALPELTSTLAGTASAAGAVAGALPELDGQLAGVGSAAGAVAGDLPELAGALTGESDAVAGTVAGDLPELDGALAGASTGLALLSGNLPELTGTLDGTVAGVATGTVGGDLPALDGQLAGAGSVAGVITGALPELVGPLVGIREGAVATRLRALQTTTLDIYAPAVAPDEWSGARTDDSLVAGGVPASIIEQTRTKNDPRTGTPRIIREVTGRVPDGTEIAATSRVVDGEGRHYAVAAVRQPRNPLWTSDVILDLVRTDQLSP